MNKAWFTVIIIVVLAIVAYFAYSYRDVWVPSEAESDITNLESQGTSDEISEIEEDLNNTSFEGLDSELLDIEKELQSAGL